MGTIGGIEFAVPVWATATALVLVLVVAWVFGVVARWLLRRRARLDATTAMVLSILGTALGLYIAGLVDKHLRVWSVTTVVLGLISSVVAVAAYGALAARLQRQRNATLAQLLSDGESDRLEFKSTARVNLRTGEKDPRMEQVIVKTVSAFLNSDGGTLLIGVADDGTPLGLEPDFATLKVPDADRFELWLRDLLTTTLGQNTAAAVGITVEAVARTTASAAVPVCRLTCSPSPRPVYLRAGENAPPEFWVRAGNSTRQLTVDAAADYVMHRWPLGAGRAVAAQIRAAVRFSAG
ncbi:AlbA family DNA-binding domain-containing protein [Gordonia lacunae]|uniref:AAA family ATPase n=1 Tax=Gordonia lacunae TaxID=417102 RepID=A0A243Q8D1_9ACTN|nr:ATP-binding protein [Gordonia lacunae]OUC77824.1 AAA family ATPase [Gordonia lacunae]